MKNLLALVGAVIVLVGGLGWYLGWYKIGTSPGSNGDTHVTVDVHGNKIKTDVKKGETVIEGLIEHNAKSVPATPASRPLEQPPGGWTLPELPKLPTPPAGGSVEYNPDGSVKVTVVPPPPTFPNKQQ